MQNLTFRARVRLRGAVRALLPIATLAAIALVESAGRRWMP